MDWCHTRLLKTRFPKYSTRYRWYSVKSLTRDTIWKISVQAPTNLEDHTYFGRSHVGIPFNSSFRSRETQTRDSSSTSMVITASVLERHSVEECGKEVR